MKLIKKILSIQDNPNSKLGRQWLWIPKFSLTPTLNISLELQLTRFEGKELTPPKTVGSYSLLFYRPKKWRIESNHIQYDGPNCLWQLGPIGISRCGLGECSTCSESQ
jgi:hypothetical protein